MWRETNISIRLPKIINRTYKKMNSAEEIINIAVQWLKLAIETIGALVIAVGVCVAVYNILRGFLAGQSFNFNQARLSLARYLALALEFQLGADILSTAIAPSWDQIGKLGAIAVIRTALNYFLMREMEEEKGQPDNNEALAK